MPESLEKSLRSDSWRPGAAIVLCNGEEFQFEKPEYVGFFPVLGESGNVSRKAIIQFGREFEECLDSAEETARRDGDIWPYVVWLADHMLTRTNYRPEIRDHYREILNFSKEKSNIDVWFQIYDVARGIDPKGRTSVG